MNRMLRIGRNEQWKFRGKRGKCKWQSLDGESVCGQVAAQFSCTSARSRLAPGDRDTHAPTSCREITQLTSPSPFSFSSSSSSFVSSSRSFSFLESVAATFVRINFDRGAPSEDQTARYRLYIIDFINYKMEHRWLSRNTRGNYRFARKGFFSL